jgi:hypothetical protein
MGSLNGDERKVGRKEMSGGREGERSSFERKLVFLFIRTERADRRRYCKTFRGESTKETKK